LAWKRDLVWGIVLLVFAVANIIYTYRLPSPAYATGIASSDVYVRLWMYILIVFTVMLLYNAIRSKGKGKTVEPIVTKTAVFTVAAIAIYLLIIDIIGFALATFLFAWISIVVYRFKEKGEVKGGKRFKVIAGCGLISLVLTIAVQQVFVRVLGVLLPTFPGF
jgi:hypothetical protein